MTDTLQDYVRALGEHGDRPALRQRTEFRSFTWTYAELARRIRAMGSWLTASGVEVGDRILIWAPNSPAWAGAFLACLAAGVVAVPLDLHSTPDFVEMVADETMARVVIRGRYQPHVNVRARVVLIDLLEWETRPGQVERDVWPALTPDDLAEILYTSGTTAQPKGVVLTHGNLCANLAGIQPVVPLEPFYRFVSLLPLSHAFEQVIGLFLPLGRGGQVTYIESLKPSALVEALQVEKPNALVLVPRLLELLRSRVEGRFPNLARRALDGLRPLLLALPLDVRRAVFRPLLAQFGGYWKFAVVGGAPLDRALEEFWDSVGVLVLQGYGLTEAAPVVTANTPAAYRVGSVGRSIANVRIELGKDGEVLVKGPSVTAGYYRRPDATRAAQANGWLRTGDLGQFDREGFLFLRGRQKDLIVTPAGLKVYPEDVEAALNRQAGVRDSVVLEWRGQVYAVLLLDPTRASAPAEIVERANRHLNRIQQIHGWTVWPGADFPRTPTLKVRKFKVREALVANQPSPVSTGRPVGRVAQIVQDLTPSRVVTPQASLGPDLDLSSIDRLELISLLEEEFHVDIPETEVGDQTTIASLERLIETGSRQKPARPSTWPLTPAVSRFRSLAQRDLIFPVLRHVLWISPEGMEHLRGLPGPVIFAGNHVSHLDGPVVLMTLPRDVRERTAVAALAGFYFPPSTNALENSAHWALFDLSELFFNVFPVPRARGFRESLRYAGFLVERCWNILIFPEGTRSWNGELSSFREGIGLLANELKVPVVPFRIRGTYRVLARGAWIPRPGPVSIRFGSPMAFPPMSYWDITREIEKAVARL